jgi:hypothetical protein
LEETLTQTQSRTPEKAALRADIAATRADLGETVDALAGKTNVKTRATGAARRAASSVRDGGREQAVRVRESVRQRPGRWAGAGTGVAALAAAVAGAVMWQRNRRRPAGRGARAWQAVSSRFSR